ncbi:MAG: hypothetical protein MI923_10025 [Phycisphaerales bacterium]|nr:hypothetical protein [Phycisphaerales bacterium]
MRFLIISTSLLWGAASGCVSNQDSSVKTGATGVGFETEVVSLLGRPLYARPSGDQKKLTQAFLQSIIDFHGSPKDLSKIVWPGRRLGYLWRMNDAIHYYTLALEKHPNHAPLYRHRGHRYISVRQFDRAIEDLEKAAVLLAGRPEEIEPDGMPNVKNIPLTTTAFNVWYHLGLARYLKGDFEGALAAYRETMKHSRRYDDNLVATTHWMYMTLRRLRRDKEAAALLKPIREDMEIIENHAYHRCVLMYKGLLKPDELSVDGDMNGVVDVTQGYGLGNWYLYRGDKAEAKKVFERVVSGDLWPGFGFIAAEADLARLRK